MKETKRIEVVGFNIGDHAILMDLEDYLYFRQFKLGAWFSPASNQYYLNVPNHKTLGFPTSTIHRLIMMRAGHDLTNLKVDFKNYNTLDLRRENLKLVTTSQVRAYSRNRLNKNNGKYASIYTGVSKDKRSRSSDKIWIAKMTVKKKSLHLGTYNTEIEAAYAYNLAAQKIYGEHANLNPITEQMVIDAKNAYNRSKKA